MKKTFELILIGIIATIVMALAGCSSSTPPETASSSSATLANSNVSASNPGRIAPNGPRGPGK